MNKIRISGMDFKLKTFPQKGLNIYGNEYNEDDKYFADIFYQLIYVGKNFSKETQWCYLWHALVRVLNAMYTLNLNKEDSKLLAATLTTLLQLNPGLLSSPNSLHNFDRVHLGPHDYSLCFLDGRKFTRAVKKYDTIDNIVNENTVRLLGYVTRRDCAILINTNQAKLSQWHTLWHELIHCAFFDRKDLAEKHIDTLGYCVVQLLRDNQFLAKPFNVG